ncbi:UbiH/UbiF/VisC/COQ6 family ubiquinone biosynthesis hydroxylase [Thiofaba sp. EF100]|uniref:UbiH/UbiF/VisC/COQ6 family ubiquinone biosynthesis hydroxylase n=1 Tax=Thiofaba sp. EF100 TaxID=3121274 RepID=UPI0032215DA7
MEQHADVLIIGGGMVGAALACALGRSGFEVHVVEAQAPEPFAPEQPLDLRVSAVSLASQALLEAVDAWPQVLAMRAVPFRRMRVWDQRSFGETVFDSRDIGEPALGHIVENRILQLALWRAAEGLASVRWHCPARLEALAIEEHGVRARLNNGITVQARLVVGADGAHSRLRELAHIGLTSWDYDVEALVATVRTRAPQQDITWQRFTPSGPQALLPLPGPHASLVWYLPPDEVARLKALDDDTFLEMLRRAFPRELGGVERLLERGSFRLTRRHAQTYCKPRLALAGDAAHTIHPLAGQGVNLGFMDVAALAEVLIKARDANEDIGALHVLQRYERWRRGENLLMQTAMDVFHHAFKPARGPLPWLRGLALHAANDLPPLRRLLTRRATGRAGDLPWPARSGRLP